VKGVFPSQLSRLKVLDSIDLNSFVNDCDDEMTMTMHNAAGKKRDASHIDFGKGNDISVDDLPPRVKDALPFADVGKSDNVGYCYEEITDSSISDALSIQSELELTSIRKKLWIKCPIGVISQRLHLF
jgi:hypothetical protein